MNENEKSPEKKEDFSLAEILSEYRAKAAAEGKDQYQIPEPKSAPAAPYAQNHLPTEEEVRAYLASFARGETEPSFTPRPQAGPKSEEVDERFRMGPSRGGVIRYGTNAIDFSADDDYKPPKTETFIPTTVDPGRDYDPDKQPYPLLIDRLKAKVREQQKEHDKAVAAEREAARKLRVSEPVELVLPGETPPPAPARPYTRPSFAAPEELDREDEQAAAEPAEVPPASATPVSEPVEEAPAGPANADDSAAPELLKPDRESGSGRKKSAKKKSAPARPRRPEPEPEEAEEEEADRPVAAAFTPSWSRTGSGKHAAPPASGADRASASHREYASLFPDTSAAPAIYAEKREDESPATKDGDARIPLRKDRFFPANFREYLATLTTTIFYGLRKGASTIITAEEDDEELGPEASPAQASRYYGRHATPLRLRFRLCLVLLFVMAWVSLDLPVIGQLGNIRVAAWFCFAVQAAIMLLCQDVLTGGVLNAFRRHFGADSMAVLACLVTSLDALLVGTGKLTTPHMPLCLVSSISLTGVLLASLLSCRGLRKSLRVPAIAKVRYTVTGEEGVRVAGTTILKSDRPVDGFVRRSEEAPADEIFFQKAGLPLLVLVVLLTLLALAFTKNLRDGVYTLSVLLCAAAPFCALLCFALPFFIGSHRIFASGAAIAGWSGLSDVGKSTNLIVTDRDLFPDGTVEIEQVRIFADARPERIISYAGSMLVAGGSAVSKPFADMMERHNITMRTVEDFEYLPGGGMKGVIDSSVILCGSSELMQLMNVKIPSRLIGSTSILLAVDGILYGIFNISYRADPKVRRALISLVRSSRHPIFAIRDFNVTPKMLRETFKVATDGYDFPPYVERFDLSSAKPDDESKPAAVVCLDGLGPLSEMANIGRRMYVAVRTNLYLTALSALFGVLLAFLRLITAGGVSVLLLFLFMLMCSLPVLFFGTTLDLE